MVNTMKGSVNNTRTGRRTALKRLSRSTTTSNVVGES
jgi:hypothetical protein